jgi:hypothetical protein
MKYRLRYYLGKACKLLGFCRDCRATLYFVKGTGICPECRKRY